MQAHRRPAATRNNQPHTHREPFRYTEEKARSERLRRVLGLLQAPGSPTTSGLPHLLSGRSAASFTQGFSGGGPFSRRATIAAASAATAPAPRSSHDGAVDHRPPSPPPLPPQGSDPTAASSSGGARPALCPSIRRTISTPAGHATAQAAAAARLGGLLGAVDSPKLRRQSIQSLFSMMMAYTVAQSVAAGEPAAAYEEDAEEPLSSISIDDDQGSSGVGLAAAAAAAAAMARAWAKAASREQRDASSGAAGGTAGLGGGGAGGGGKAGFRLVATVTNKMGAWVGGAAGLGILHGILLGPVVAPRPLPTSDITLPPQTPPHNPPGKRRQSQANLSTSASQDSLLEASSSPYASTQSLQGAAAANPLAPGPSSLGPPSRLAAAGAALPPAGPSAAAARQGAAAAAAASADGGDAGGAAGAAASAPASSGQGSNIALHWLSRPRNVLVMRKLATTTEGVFQAAVEWLL
jgi:hypothetical protein